MILVCRVNATPDSLEPQPIAMVADDAPQKVPRNPGNYALYQSKGEAKDGLPTSFELKERLTVEPAVPVQPTVKKIKTF